MSESAFPHESGLRNTGIAIRDYFAAGAISGFSKGMVDYGWDDEVLIGHVKMAYRLADAMLEERIKDKKESRYG